MESECGMQQSCATVWHIQAQSSADLVIIGATILCFETRGCCTERFCLSTVRMSQCGLALKYHCRFMETWLMDWKVWPLYNVLVFAILPIPFRGISAGTGRKSLSIILSRFLIMILFLWMISYCSGTVQSQETKSSQITSCVQSKPRLALALLSYHSSSPCMEATLRLSPLCFNAIPQGLIVRFCSALLHSDASECALQ